ncbi:MAG: amino acid ABC transporter permease, partial [Hyphomicrobiaceae bacterium]
MAVETHDGIKSDEQGKASFFYDPRVRAIFSQVVLFALLAWAGYAIVANTIANLERQNIASGFGFLKDTAGFGIIQTLVPYTEVSSYGWTFVVGLLNTILVAVVGIVLTTALGFVIGVARLSANWVVSNLAYVYVEIMRNIPLLLHIFIWYFAVLRAVPGKREKWSLFDTVHVNIIGIWAPMPVTHDGFSLVVIAFVLAIIGAFFVARWAKTRQAATGQQFPVFWAAVGIIVGLPLFVYLATGMPLTFEHPVFKTDGPMLRRGFQQDVGLNIIPEFLALLFALSSYTAAYIAEIVRAGIMAVSHGQTEASHALGIRPGPTLRLVVIPQAMRVIIPPMTNQYLNLTKNSSLAVAIAYPDLVSVFAGTTLNQTGQAVEILLMTMGVYLTLSLLISMVMNWYNARIALV